MMPCRTFSMLRGRRSLIAWCRHDPAHHSSGRHTGVAMDCPHCGKRLPLKALRSEMARMSAAKRKTYGAGTGRPPKLEPCARCGEMMSATERRKHKCN